MSEPLRVLTGTRRTGKTTKAIEWMKQGERCPGYPGWTRVLILPTSLMVIPMRHALRDVVEDIDHRLYSWTEWRDMRGVSDDVEVLVDELTMMLPRIPGRLVGVTINGENWLRDAWFNHVEAGVGG